MNGDSVDVSIFTVICDVSITTLKSKFSSYTAICVFIKECLDNNLSELVEHYIIDIYNIVNQIYCMNVDTMVNYIRRYFIESRFMEYYELMQAVRGCFGEYVKIGN